MQDDDKKHQNQFDASLPLPMSEEDKKQEHEDAEPESSQGPNPAADLIRKKLQKLYDNEPNAQEEITEAKEAEETEPNSKLSKHQKFILDLTSSGKSLSDVQAEWHDYYAGLNDADKHEVWQEFYNSQSQHSHYKAAAHKLGEPKEDKEAHAIIANQEHILKSDKQPHVPNDPISRSMADLKGYFGDIAKSGGISHKTRSVHHHLKSLAFGLSIGCIVLVIFLFGLFNERIIAPFIQPSRNITNTPIISTNVVSSNPEIVIPKINVEIPVVYDVTTTNDNDVENALEDGVVHYADTALPGQDGNLVIVGHSSNNIFNPGKYKFAFVLLSRLDNGDTFYLTKDGKRYTYQVYKKEIVGPSDVSVLGLTDKTATATLITCDPPGTSINRLVVIGEQIDPSPASNTAATTKNTAATNSAIIPGNSPTLWSRIVKWLES